MKAYRVLQREERLRSSSVTTNSLYAEIDRLRAEVDGLRRLCQQQDQELQELDGWRLKWKAIAWKYRVLGKEQTRLFY